MILIDLHSWIYLVSGQIENISEKALKKINNSPVIALSAISCWEAAFLVEKIRLILEMDTEVWVNNALNYPNLNVIDLTPEILIKSVMIDNLHSDPADRIIVSTCLLNSFTLITADSKFHLFNKIKTIW